MDEVSWNVGLPLIRVAVDGTSKVLQYLGASEEVSKPGMLTRTTLDLSLTVTPDPGLGPKGSQCYGSR